MESNSVIVSVVTHEGNPDDDLMVIGKPKESGQGFDILNAIQGKEVLDIWKTLTEPKEKK